MFSHFLISSRFQDVIVLHSIRIKKLLFILNVSITGSLAKK